MADPSISERSFPFATGQGAAVTEDDWSAMANTWQDDGVVDAPGGTGLTVVPGVSPNTIQINVGSATIDGFTYRLTAPKTIPTTTNPGSVARNDLVVLRHDSEQIVPVILANTTLSALPASAIPLGTWSQLPDSSATSSNWGSAADVRWFTGSRMRPALAGSIPPATAGGIMFQPSVGATGMVYMGSPNGTGGATWIPWIPGQLDINVLNYGAIGNGVADDAPAIQSALTYIATNNPGARLLIPPGTYLVKSELEIKSSVHLDLAKGAVIKRGLASMQYIFKNFNSTYAPTLYAGRGGIRITGGTIDANGASLTGAVTSVAFAHALDVKVEGTTFLNVRDLHGVELAGCRDASVENCIFQGFNSITSATVASGAVNVDAVTNSTVLPGIGAGAYDNTVCDNVRISGNTVREFGALGSYGRLASSSSFVNGVFNTRIRITGNYAQKLNDYMVGYSNWNDVIIANNTCVDSNGGVWVSVGASATSSADTVEVIGNVYRNMGIKNNAAAVLDSVLAFTGNASPLMPVTGVTVSNNTIKTFAGTYGIKGFIATAPVISANTLKSGSAAAGIGIQMFGCADGVINANKVDAVPTGIDNSDTGSVTSENVILSANNVSNCATAGIRAQSSTNQVINNSVRSCGNLTFAGLYLNGPYWLLVGNQIWLGSAAGTQYGTMIGVGGANGFSSSNFWRGWGTTLAAAGAPRPAAPANIFDNSTGSSTSATTNTYSSTQKAVAANTVA